MKKKHLVPIITMLAFVATFLALNRAGPAATSAEDTFDYLPVVFRPENTPTATATATNTPILTSIPIPTSTPVPTATNQPPPAGCSICSYDAYNCSNFSTQASAQSCHDYCFAIVGYDVHGLDSDGDGEACESLP